MKLIIMLKINLFWIRIINQTISYKKQKKNLEKKNMKLKIQIQKI